MDFNKKNDIIKQDTFLKMQSSEHLKIWWTLFRRCLLIIIWKGKKYQFLSWIFLWQFNSHHINAWKNYVNWNGLLDFFIGITKRLLFLANVKRKIYSHKELQILFQHYHENYLDKITFQIEKIFADKNLNNVFLAKKEKKNY